MQSANLFLEGAGKGEGDGEGWASMNACLPPQQNAAIPIFRPCVVSEERRDCRNDITPGCVFSGAQADFQGMARRRSWIALGVGMDG